MRCARSVVVEERKAERTLVFLAGFRDTYLMAGSLAGGLSPRVRVKTARSAYLDPLRGIGLPDIAGTAVVRGARGGGVVRGG